MNNLAVSINAEEKQTTREYYHRAVYMPHKVLSKAVKNLNKACNSYPMELSKHFQKRLSQHMKY